MSKDKKDEKPEPGTIVTEEIKDLYVCDCGHIVKDTADEENHLKETHDPTWAPKDATDEAKSRAKTAKTELEAKAKVEVEAKKNLEIQTEQGNLESEKEKELNAESEINPSEPKKKKK